MKFTHLHPADQIVAIMNRIYKSGLTTTSGGNLSILEDNGDIWITPGGIDKGTLTRNDICFVKSDGTVIGPHKPSVELPFHASIYKKRPDIRAVLHAHPPKMVAFSVIRRLPELNLTSNSRHTCGNITIAPYAVPGSAELGENISVEFSKGFNIVVLENHGLVIGSDDLFDCFMKFETLEATAKLQINASKLGPLKLFADSELNLISIREHQPAADIDGAVRAVGVNRIVRGGTDLSTFDLDFAARSVSVNCSTGVSGGTDLSALDFDFAARSVGDNSSAGVPGGANLSALDIDSAAIA